MKEQTELVEAFTQDLPQGAPVGLILVEGTEFLSQSIDYYRRLGVEALILLERRPDQKVSLD
ncbi:MAG: hypothetical protein AAF679_14555, partial [Pseudomonadota bacterium]